MSTRRNGQLASCEPCRKSKLRCDHSTPTCHRCLRRGLSTRCVYHPAPLTKPGAPRKQQSTPECKTQKTSSFSLVSIDGSVPSPDRSLYPEVRQDPFTTSGFLGPTSYRGTFDGTATGLDDERDSTAMTSWSCSVGHRQIEQGARILSLLEHCAFYEEAIDKKLQWWSGGWVLGAPFLGQLTAALKELYTNAVKGARDVFPRLLDLSRILFRNTAADITTSPEMTLQEYVSANAPRWEMISILFSTVGWATYVTPYCDELFQRKNIPGKTREGLRLMAISANDTCLQFCDTLGTITDPFCWATLQHGIFLSRVHGCGDYRTWKKVGDLTSIIFALGLHQGSSTSDDSPFFLTEIRKRTMVAAYAVDKEVATVLGRPPRICWRYCDIAAPLDISYDELAGDAAVREAALRALDSNGWNTEGDIRKGLRPRAILLCSIMREKILEVLLNPQMEDLESKVKNLCEESRQMRASLPVFFQWTPDEGDPYIASLHAEFLYHDVLLYRSLVKRTNTGYEFLFQRCLDILTVLLDEVTKQIRLARTSSYLVADLCHIGLPAAGVLSTELLRQTENRPSAASFPRSEVVQKLSVFLSHVDTFIRPQEGDYEISRQGRTIIGKVLDRAVAPPESDPLMYNGSVLDQGMDLVAQLEEFDWEQEIQLTFG